MYRFRSGIVGIVLMAGLAGCGSSVDEGPRPFTPTNTDPFNALTDQMKERMKKGDYLQKAVPTEKEKEAGKDKKDAPKK